MVKEHGILFKPEMIKQILAGNKTMTRRAIKLADGSSPQDDDISWNLDDTVDKIMDFTKTYPYWKECKPKYQVGDLLYVKEAVKYFDGKWVYKFEKPDPNADKKFKSPLFMPKHAARIWLRITDIKPERVQDISEEDAIKEGIDTNKISGDYEHTPACEFENLWKSINGKESWDNNIWVWCYGFERIDLNLNL